MARPRILVVRLGSMGDILHALPAVALLRRTWPDSAIDWVVHPKWRDLLAANPLGLDPIYVDRKSASSLRQALSRLRATAYDFAIDFQGLIQSAIVTRVARRAAAYGFHRSLVREWPAALFYTHALRTAEPHVVGRNLALAVAAGAAPGPVEFLLPPGCPEGELPERFVLAAPLAGWTAKQWPLEYYAPLARRLRESFGLSLVLNGPPSSEPLLRTVAGAHVHISGLSGLIDATRRATAVLGLDSGPMHLAAALGKPGVALFGPTDPARNGPYGNSLTVLRHASAMGTYTRGSAVDPSLRALTPDIVFVALNEALLNAQSVGDAQPVSNAQSPRNSQPDLEAQSPRNAQSTAAPASDPPAARANASAGDSAS
ncbi:MAG: glycosyltransferase family 9 protein [Bryobacteraceae bacterium]|jgi:heptosyltransferase-1